MTDLPEKDQQSFVLDCMKNEIDALKRQLHEVNARLLRTVPWASMQFQLHLTHHCNLDCYACQHFSVLADEWNITLESLDSQLNRMAELFPDKLRGVHKIWLMGGEPLLHPDVIGVFETVRKYFSFPEVVFLTNGILLPKQPEDFWTACSKHAITVEVTPYPLSLDSGIIEGQAKKHGVVLRGENNLKLNDIHTRKSIQGMKPFRREGDLDPREMWIDCDQANFCMQLLDGKLYQCASVAYIPLLNKYFDESFMVTDSDYIDIFKAKTAGEIYDFLSKPIPFCRYCNHKRGMLFDWQQSKKHPCEFLDWEAESEKLLEKEEYASARKLANEILAHGAFGHAKKWAFRILAESYERQGDFGSAIDAAEKWLEAEPSRALPRELLARLYRLNGELDRAEQLAMSYLNNNTQRVGWAFRELCYVNAARGKREQAREYGQKALQAHPGHASFENFLTTL